MARPDDVAREEAEVRKQLALLDASEKAEEAEEARMMAQLAAMGDDGGADGEEAALRRQLAAMGSGAGGYQCPCEIWLHP